MNPEFNLNNVIRSLSGDKSIDIGFELEQSKDLILKGHRSTGQGIVIPSTALVSTRNFNQSTTGKSLVTEEQRPDLFIEALRPHSVAVQAGVTMLNGLVGNVTIPKQTGTAAASWLNLDGVDEIEESTPTVGSVGLSMKSLAALVPITHNLLKQSTPNAEMLVKHDLLKVIGQALDHALISGSGANNQPLGILNHKEINKIQLPAKAAMPNFKQLIDMFGLIAGSNADTGTLAYLTSPDVATALMSSFIEAGTAQTIWTTTPTGETPQ